MKSQFHNIFEGQKRAHLKYLATYTGNDDLYAKTYDQNLIDEIAEQTDFWDCVHGFNEAYSVEVEILDDVEGKDDLIEHLTSLIVADMKSKTGKLPGESFFDSWEPGKREEQEAQVNDFKMRNPNLFRF